MTGAMVGTSIVFFPAALFFLFMHGKEISIPKGTEITAYVNGNARLDAHNFQPRLTTPTVPLTENSKNVPASAQVARPADQADSEPSSDWKDKYWPKQQPKPDEKKTPPK
jgi:hypothetical protein